jgi:hypothetical protein
MNVLYIGGELTACYPPQKKRQSWRFAEIGEAAWAFDFAIAVFNHDRLLDVRIAPMEMIISGNWAQQRRSLVFDKSQPTESEP